MKEQIGQLVLQVAKEFNISQCESRIILIEQGENASLFGAHGVLDSLGLVNFIVEVEQAIEDELNVSVQLVSEKAMSQKNSPFLTIGTLVGFVEQLVNEAKNNE